MDLFRSQGIDTSQTVKNESLKKAYRELIKTHHPDRHGNTAESHQIFQSITDAYNKLSKGLIERHSPKHTDPLRRQVWATKKIIEHDRPPIEESTVHLNPPLPPKKDIPPPTPTPRFPTWMRMTLVMTTGLGVYLIYKRLQTNSEFDAYKQRMEGRRQALQASESQNTSQLPRT